MPPPSLSTRASALLHRTARLTYHQQNHYLHHNGHRAWRHGNGICHGHWCLQPPHVSISAQPQTIIEGETSTLTWSSEHADSASLDNGIGYDPSKRFDDSLACRHDHIHHNGPGTRRHSYGKCDCYRAPQTDRHHRGLVRTQSMKAIRQP